MSNGELHSKNSPVSESLVIDENAASPEFDVERAELALKYLEARIQMNTDLDYSPSWPGDYLDSFESLEQDALDAGLITPRDSLFHQPKKTK